MNYFIVALVVFVIIADPLALVWSINTLFGVGIDYNFYTWLAAFLLGGAVSGNSVKTSS